MKLATLVACLTLIAAPVLAQDTEAIFPEPLSDTVSDFAEVLDATEEGRISRLLSELRSSTGVQMVVVTLPGRAGPEGAPVRLEDYGKALFNAWEVGTAERNDGILLLVDAKAGEARIALGAGYDPVYDGRAARVLTTAVLPEFLQGRIAAGIEAGVLSARDRLIQPFLAGQPVSVSDGFPEEESTSLLPILGFGGFVGFILYRIWQSRRARRLCPSCGAPTLQNYREVIDPPTKDASGTAIQHLNCPSCGFTDRKTYPVSFSSREAREDRGEVRAGSEKGKSSGFGGGRSSGGGASGKW